MPLRKSSVIDIAPPSEYKSSQKSHHSQTPSYSSNCSTSSNVFSRSLSSSSTSDSSFDSKRLEIMKTQTIEWSYEPASHSDTEKSLHSSNTYHTWETQGPKKDHVRNSEMGKLSSKKQRWTKD
ncbi:uncharacterized protein EAE97_005657 [Botrytis byssoidea]|uniref:Uncharacterized protein n=1 Tax=Botrytis byssoidea TaxID=139641 RepID=A0A9P5M5D0_9HELO|nr:uncharacterized protein EAE97_005657 [Botrytis byssoidea]KAF7943586.1 hypothetical protein EAE97_005657 [Botrytis byssoidea]